VKKKIQIFDDLMEGFTEAIKYRKGDKKARVLVSRFAVAVDPLRPADIRKIRMKLHVSQPLFAQYIGVSLGAVRSWEQGIRKPNRAALRLLTIAKENPSILLQRSAATYRR
jgi:putative transcriptional regulator